VAVIHSRSGRIGSLSGSRSVPRLAKLGAATIAFGAVYDLSEHSYAVTTASGGFSPGEHAAHLVVLIGMVTIILGVIADGIHGSSRRSRQEGSSRDAIR